MDLTRYLGRRVIVVIDRPLGSKHPRHDFDYPVNYGYLPGTEAADGGGIDAYYLGLNGSVESAEGEVIAVIHRLHDADDKLVVVPLGMQLSDGEIEEAVAFVERWFQHCILSG